MGVELHLDGVPLEHLMLVRVQSGLEGVRADNQGRLVLSRRGSGREDFMNTFHFALNGAVTNHVLGSFDHAIAFISPLRDTCAIDGQRPAGLDGADTYFHADANREMTLADAAIIAPTGTQLPTGLAARAIFYEPGCGVEAMLASRNAAIAQEMERRNAPLRTVAPVGWREAGVGKTSDEEYRALGRALSCPDLRRNGHMNSPDWCLPMCLAVCDGIKNRFSKGQRLWTNDEGVQKDLIGEYRRQVELPRVEFHDLMAQTGCPRAQDFYGVKIEKAEMTLERLQKIRDLEIKREDAEEARLAGMPKEWYLGVDGKPIGPMTILEVRDYACDCDLSSNALVWRAGMAGWAEAATVMELTSAVPAFRNQTPTVAPPPTASVPPPVDSAFRDLAPSQPAVIFNTTVRAPHTEVSFSDRTPKRSDHGLGI